MARRRVGAIAEYKRHAREIRRQRAKGISIVPPVAGRPTYAVVSDRAGGWDVFLQGRKVASGFDTRDDAQEWIDDQ